MKKSFRQFLKEDANMDAIKSNVKKIYAYLDKNDNEKIDASLYLSAVRMLKDGSVNQNLKDFMNVLNIGGGFKEEYRKAITNYFDEDDTKKMEKMVAKFNKVTATTNKQIAGAKKIDEAVSNSFTKWLDKFLDEKGINLEDTFTIPGKSGSNFMSYQVVVEHIKVATPNDQAKIKAMLVKIDFQNASVEHFLRHLAQAIAQ